MNHKCIRRFLVGGLLALTLTGTAPFAAAAGTRAQAGPNQPKGATPGILTLGGDLENPQSLLRALNLDSILGGIGL
jgi:hypothetical protein